MLGDSGACVGGGKPEYASGGRPDAVTYARALMVLWFRVSSMVEKGKIRGSPFSVCEEALWVYN